MRQDKEKFSADPGGCTGWKGRTERSWWYLLLMLAGVVTGNPLEGMRVVGTVGMVTDLAERVGGDRVEVAGLLGSGVDPHLYKPTRTDVVTVSHADLILYNGLHLEGRMGELFERMAGRGIEVLAVAEAALERAGLEALGGNDPHVWMDVGLWQGAVWAIADKMGEVDPDGAEAYRENAGRYVALLENLEAYGREVLGSIPAERRMLVTAHDAFGYFGEAYGVEVRGIQGISTESEAGVRDLERLLGLVLERRVPVIFVEDTVSEKNVRALVEGAQARGWDLGVGGTLFSDAMGPEGKYTGTYVGMMDHNFTTIADALGGDVPAGGFQGKLEGGAGAVDREGAE